MKNSKCHFLRMTWFFIQKTLKTLPKNLEINKYNEVKVYKINVQKSTAFLYTNNEISEKEILKIPFVTATTRIKYLGISLTKDVKDLYTKNYKALLKGILKDTIK